MLTPDSSRYWPADGYEVGRGQPSFDKQYVRDWASASGWDKQPPAPAIPDDVVAGTRARYIEAYERITGEPFADWLARTGRVSEGACPDPPEGGDPRPAGRGRRARAARARLRGRRERSRRPPGRARRPATPTSSQPMCEKLLANPLVEDYEIQVLDER